MTTLQKITRFDRTSANLFSDAVMSMFQAFARQAGVEVTRELGRFNENTFTMKISFRVLAQDGSGMPADFACKALMVGAPPDSWGKVFTQGWKSYKITDIKPRNTRYPILATCVQDGKAYKFPALVGQNAR